MTRSNTWQCGWKAIFVVAVSMSAVTARAQALQHGETPIAAAAVESAAPTTALSASRQVAASDNVFRREYFGFSTIGPFEKSLDGGIAFVPEPRMQFFDRSAPSGYPHSGYGLVIDAVSMNEESGMFGRLVGDSSSVVAPVKSSGDEEDEGILAAMLHWVHKTADRFSMLPLVSATRAEHMPVLNCEVSLRGQAFRSVGLKKFWKF